MESWASILSIVEAKGWYLYQARRRADPAGLVAQGPARTIERDVPYEILPAASVVSLKCAA